MKTQIVYEDNEILVIYKPEGLAAQSARVTQADVVSEICGYLKSPYVGLVHRLDQPVEGLMVLGKTKAAAANLSSQVTAGNLEKMYVAVVSDETGKTETDATQEQWTELTDYLEKDAKAGKARIVKSGGQKATLFYRKLSTGPDNTALLEIRLITGRFHQIRTQMSHANLPLLGDVKYGSEKSQKLSGDRNVRSVALCAYKLSFLHPKTKKEMNFEIRPHKPVFNSYDF
ncbi:MAG: RluA family pseudouridine synthase [Lachnospiraceae bacterium]|nr:RluA family pseudouridine synthase [Lachnospiraceae bacterium]